MRAILLISVLTLWSTWSGHANSIKNKSPICENCKEIKTQLKLNIFPNPCEDNCHLKINGVSNSEVAHLFIMDLTGKQVFKYAIEDGEIEFTFNKSNINLHQGTYLVQLKKDEEVTTKRMVIK